MGQAPRQLSRLRGATGAAGVAVRGAGRGQRGRRPAAPGFTLVEVLVALAIIAVVLTAALGLAGMTARDAARQRALTEAGWVALNHLAAIRVAEPWPGLGTRHEDTVLGAVRWTVSRTVTPTADPSVRRVDVAVGREGSERVLARRSTLVVRHG